jgi:gluconolactonase
VAQSRAWITALAVLTPTLYAAADGRLVRLAPEFDAIAAADARIEKVASGFTFIEGPVWSGDGFLLFSDVRANRIMRWSPRDGASLFRDHSGIDADMPAGKPYGSNGLTLDRQGRLVMCQHGERRIVRLEKDGKLTVLADRYEGKRLNSPNDLVYKSDGALYFTDPPYGLFPGYDRDPRKELPFSGVFRLAGGKLTYVLKDLPRPNGLAFSPDEEYLYIANSEPPQKLWMRYAVNPDGSLGEGKVFFDANDIKEEGLPDGLKVDRQGNVYCAGPGGLWVFSPEGKPIGRIQPDELPANCAWGGTDGKDLYMTARTGLYRVHLKVPGIRP